MREKTQHNVIKCWRLEKKLVKKVKMKISLINSTLLTLESDTTMPLNSSGVGSKSRETNGGCLNKYELN